MPDRTIGEHNVETSGGPKWNEWCACDDVRVWMYTSRPKLTPGPTGGLLSDEGYQRARGADEHIAKAKGIESWTTRDRRDEMGNRRPRHNEIINEEKAIVARFNNHFHQKLIHGTLQVWELELLDMVCSGNDHRHQPLSRHPPVVPLLVPHESWVKDVYMDREQQQDHDEIVYQEYLASQEISTASLEESPSKSMLDHLPGGGNHPELQTASCTELYDCSQPLQNPLPLCVFNKVPHPICGNNCQAQQDGYHSGDLIDAEQNERHNFDIDDFYKQPIERAAETSPCMNPIQRNHLYTYDNVHSQESAQHTQELKGVVYSHFRHDPYLKELETGSVPERYSIHNMDVRRQIARLWLPPSQGEVQRSSPLGQKNVSRQQNPLGCIGDNRQRPAPAAAEQNELWVLIENTMVL